MREIIYHEELKELKPYAVELPEVTGPLPDTEESYSFNAARRQNCPVDLEKYGYVEEEFIISGYANVYEYHDVGLYPKIRCENGPYTTRILVRRPKDPLRQSDFAILEIFNYAGPDKAFAGWGFCGEYMLSRGDVWVGITIKQNAVEGLKRFDPKRYGTLGFPNPVPKDRRRPVLTIMGTPAGAAAGEYESGLAYDAMGQAAALLKAKDPKNPLFRTGISRFSSTAAPISRRVRRPRSCWKRATAGSPSSAASPTGPGTSWWRNIRPCGQSSSWTDANPVPPTGARCASPAIRTESSRQSYPTPAAKDGIISGTSNSASGTETNGN